MLPEMMMVIDGKSRNEEAESAVNGTHWAARDGVFATGTPFLHFPPRKLQHSTAGEYASPSYSGFKVSSTQ